MNIDNTKRRCYALCPRKYYWEHCANLRPMTGSSALRFGLTWHSMMEGYYGVIKDKGWSAKGEAMTKAILAGKDTWEKESKDRQFYNDYRTLENALTAFTGHISHYQDDEQFLEVEAVEETFCIDINGEFNFTGKIDGKVRLNGTRWLMEHKTTGQPIDKQLRTLQRDPQVIGYCFAGMGNGGKENHIEGILIPMLHVSATKSRTTGDYGKPRFDYRRSPQIFTSGDIKSWFESLVWTARQIIDSIEHNNWPMQMDSCYHYGACVYTALCEQNAPITDTNTDNYVVVPEWNVLEEN